LNLRLAVAGGSSARRAVIMNRTSVDHPYTTVRRELRFSVGFGDLTRALESLLGRLDVDVIAEIAAKLPRERLRERLAAVIGPSGFALFQKIDHGAMLRSLTGRDVQAITYVVGNALLAIEMTSYEPTVGLYVPPRLYVCEREPGATLVTYDVPSATLAQFDVPRVSAIASTLDARVEKLVDVAAALALKRRARSASRVVTDEAGHRR